MYFQPTSDDIETLKEIRDDKNELKLYRVEAGFNYALLNFDIGNRFEAAEGYREAIRIGEKKNKADDTAKVMHMKPTLDGRVSMLMTPMDEIAARIVHGCHKNLDELTKKTGSDPFESLFRPPTMRSDGSVMPNDTKVFSMPQTTKSTSSTKDELTEDDFQTLIKVGGDVCDCCGKSNVSLSSCARCKISFYCSKE